MVLYIEIDQQAILVNSSTGNRPAACDMRLYDLSGSLVLQTTTAGNSAQLNVSNLSDGTYFLHLNDGINSMPEIKQILIKH